MKKTKSSEYSAYLTKYDLTDNKQTEGEYEKVQTVLKDIKKSKEYRTKNNFFGIDGGAGGTDSGKKWDRQIKQWLGWYKPIDGDVWKSNVKLPETSGRIESFLHAIQNSEMVFTCASTVSEEEDQTRIIAAAIDYAIYQSDFVHAATDWHRNALINGSGIARWVYKKIERKVRYVKTKDLTDKEKKIVEEGGVVYTEPVKKVIYDGFVLRSIPRHEFFEGTKGCELQGNDKLVDYCGWKRKMSLEDFREEFKNNPQAKNVDKVKGLTESENDEDSKFQKEPDSGNKDVVIVYEYENIKKDQYIVVANDVLIIDAPLPYAHKQFTFHKVNCITKDGDFNGIGIADLTENLQGTSEILLNMMIDKVYRGLNQKFLIESGIYGEFTEQLIQEDTQFIPVNTVDGRALSSKIAPLDNEFVNQDSFQILATLGRYSTMATLVDPANMNMQKTNISATAIQNSTQVIEAAVNSFLKNLIRAYKYIGTQTWEIIKQKWSIPKIITVAGEDGKEMKMKQYRQIPIQGFEMVDGDSKIKLRQIWDKYSTITLTPDLMETKGVLDIRIAPHALQMRDKATDAQRLGVAMTQMMPFAIDPSDPLSKQQPGVKLYDARILAKEQVKVLGLPVETSLSWGFDDIDDVEIAVEDVTRILSGEYVSGVPGRSARHNLYENNVLSEINNKLANLQNEMEKTMMPPQLNPMTGMMTQPEMNPALMDQFNQMSQIAKMFADHLAVDSLPRTEREAQAIMATKDFTQGPPPPQGMQSQQKIPMPPSQPKNMGNPISYMQNNGGQPQQLQ